MRYNIVRVIYVLAACLCMLGFAQEASGLKGKSEAEHTDTLLFTRLANIYETFRVHGEQIWASSYRFEQKPLVLVYRSPSGDLMHAYVINHPNAVSLATAELVETDVALKLPSVYKITDLPKVVKNVNHFDFQADIAGTASFIMAYNDKSVDAFAAPVSADWDAFLVHEGLHDQQFASWKVGDNELQDEASYPLAADDIASIQLETKLLIDALKAPDAAKRDEILKQFIAVRSERMEKSNIVKYMDGSQERYEGTARYIEYRLAAFIPNKDQYDMISYLEASLSPNVRRDELTFGRFYSTGAALSELLDRMDLNWKPQIEAGETHYEVLTEYFALTNNSQAKERLLKRARVVYDYASLQLSAVETAANVDEGYEGFDMAGSSAAIEEIQKPYEQLSVSPLSKSLPEGYELLGGFSAESSELDPFFQEAYSPDAGVVSIIDYGSPEGDRIRLSSSVYSGDLDGVSEAMIYWESEPVELGSTMGLLYSISEDDASYSDLGFLYEGRWYTLSGSVSPEQIKAMARELMALP